MEYICDFLGKDYIMFDVDTGKFRLQERSEYDSYLLTQSSKDRKKFAMKVILSSPNIKELITKSGNKYGKSMFQVKVAYALDDVVTLDGRLEDCVMFDFHLDYFGSFRSDCYYYNLTVDAYFYCAYNEFIVDSKEYDFHLNYVHRCPLELIWRLLKSPHSQQSYLNIYLEFLGEDIIGIIENVLNDGAFGTGSITDTSGDKVVTEDKLWEYFSLNSRIDLNKGGTVDGYEILNYE